MKVRSDMKIETDKALKLSRPDIVLFEKGCVCKIVDVSCPFDTRDIEKEQQKIDWYQGLRWEMKMTWDCKEVKVIGGISIGFRHWLDQFSPNTISGTLHTGPA